MHCEDMGAAESLPSRGANGCGLSIGRAQCNSALGPEFVPRGGIDERAPPRGENRGNRSCSTFLAGDRGEVLQQPDCAR